MFYYELLILFPCWQYLRPLFRQNGVFQVLVVKLLLEILVLCFIKTDFCSCCRFTIIYSCFSNSNSSFSLTPSYLSGPPFIWYLRVWLSKTSMCQTYIMPHHGWARRKIFSLESCQKVGKRNFDIGFCKYGIS